MVEGKNQRVAFDAHFFQGVIEQLERLSHQIDALLTRQGQLVQGRDNRQGFMALNRKYEKALACFVKQENIVQKGADRSKISSDTSTLTGVITILRFFSQERRRKAPLFACSLPNFSSPGKNACWNNSSRDVQTRSWASFLQRSVCSLV